VYLDSLLPVEEVISNEPYDENISRSRESTRSPIFSTIQRNVHDENSNGENDDDLLVKSFSQADECIVIDINKEVKGDILVNIYHSNNDSVPNKMAKWVKDLTAGDNKDEASVLDKVLKPELLFRFAFHTSFVKNYVLDLHLLDLDPHSGSGPLLDERFSDEFMVRCFFEE